MHQARHQHGMKDRLDRLRYQRLQRIALDRQFHARHAHHHTAMPCRHHADTAGGDMTKRGIHAGDAAAFTLQSGDRAVLDDVYAEFARGARVAPRDRIMPRIAAALLDDAAQHRITAIRARIQQRRPALHFARRQQLAIDAVQMHGACAPFHFVQFVACKREIDHPALTEHGVEIELLAQSFPQFQCVLVQMRAVVPHVIGAHDRGVAPGVAEPDRAFFQHCYIADAVKFGKIVRSCQPMPAAADDYHVITFFGLRGTPRARPMLMTAQRIARKVEKRIAHKKNGKRVRDSARDDQPSRRCEIRPRPPSTPSSAHARRCAPPRSGARSRSASSASISRRAPRCPS